LFWDVLGPLVGFRVSHDLCKTWIDTPNSPTSPIFSESGLEENWVKFGAPHFVDFGQNMGASPDGYAYLVGHGSMTSAQNLSLMTGDDVFLARVLPSPETVNDTWRGNFSPALVQG